MNTLWKAGFSFGALLYLVTAPGWCQEPAVAPKTYQPQSIVYKRVGDTELKLHFFFPPGHNPDDQRPAIVFFFGGGWTSGSPSQFYGQAWYLSQRGMVAACAEYRVKQRNDTPPTACVEDGKSAMRFLRREAARFGVDPQRIVAAGGSAGGQVAAATATVQKFNQPGEDVSIRCVPNALVLFNPVIDNGPDGWGHDRVADYWKEFSPMHNIRAGIPPCLFLLGDQDKLLPVDTAREFERRVHEAGGQCTVSVYPNQGHGFFNKGSAFRDTLKETDRFLAALGYLQGPETVDERFAAAAAEK